MKNQTCSFVEKICGVTFIVNVHSANDAKIPQEEFVKRLIVKEALTLTADDN